MSLQPRFWSPDELVRLASDSERVFIEERTTEPLEKYGEDFDEARGFVEDFLELTTDMAYLQENALEVVTNRGYLRALRFLGAPFVSEADLGTVANTTLSAGRMRTDPDAMARVIDTVLLVLDRRRFAWVSENREPTDAEREAAILATAALMATESTRTWRRHQQKKGQEGEVAELLESLGFEEAKRKRVDKFADGPKPGTFYRETHFGPKRADIIVGLHDGRYLPMECKVTNSPVNSFKRVNKDAVGSANDWRVYFGAGTTVTGVVISGVFRAQNLVEAQDTGLSLFWSHDLTSLSEFVENAR